MRGSQFWLTPSHYQNLTKRYLILLNVANNKKYTGNTVDIDTKHLKTVHQPAPRQ